MDKKILIIKLGAIGDVLRTTPILRILNGEITWVADKESIPILALAHNHFINRLLTIDSVDKIKNETFDLILSLDENYRACRLAAMLKHKRLVGSYLQNRKVGYTKSSVCWFNMSKISHKGLTIANILKKKNTYSYQELLFKMMGRKFLGENYVFKYPINNTSSNIIGLESRVGEKWPTKLWKKYNELANLLKKEGYNVILFKQKKTIQEYIEYINRCRIVVTGDSLAMHLGLALNKKVVALFGPTSATEIYGYDRLIKIVSPISCVYCYKKNCSKKPDCMDLIDVNNVFNIVKTNL